METEYILELQNVTKTFGSLVAVDDISFQLHTGEIHAILGENGAGKSTLMNLIYGLYQPTHGQIFISGQLKHLQSPRDAIANGIGMVHQHFMLVDNLTVAENIALYLSHFSIDKKNSQLLESEVDHPSKLNKKESKISPNFVKWLFKMDEAIQLTETLSQKFDMTVDPYLRVGSLSVGLKQRVEILKALAVDARILILDEPTAVLSPQEVKNFFQILHTLQEDNRTVIFISHKMKEVLEISDRITVLRHGKKVYTGKTGDLSAQELAREMLGEELSDIQKKKSKVIDEPVLSISGLSVKGSQEEITVNNVSMETYRGEIVGVAGVDGNGQKEFAESIMGLQPITAGTVQILSKQITSTENIRRNGVAYVSEDRRTTGIIGTFTIADNLMLNISHFERVTHHGIIDQNTKRAAAENMIKTYDIRPPNPNLSVSALSGGNQQKVVIARELSTEPELLVAVNPTRGLDISAAQFVHQALLEQRDNEKSVLLISTELEEVLQLSDRLFVMSRGNLIEATDYRDSIEAIGLLMMGERIPDEL
ncbi:ABC transporter ATP-binding protein [Candidatus Poribacteria bacterium]|nr:ABC transporter ATP-binding protein [Candidatus Poribacteria bacterium]